jgi:hypothetical protein
MTLMRVLPYFNSIAPSAKNVRTSPVSAKQTVVQAATQTEAKPANTAPVTDDGFKDMFIPSSPVKGVVMKSVDTVSATGSTAAGNKGSEKVLKSGTYSFYRIDGRLEKESPLPVSTGLNIIG